MSEVNNYEDLIYEIKSAPTASIKSPNAEFTISTDGLPERFVSYVKHVAEANNVPLETTLLSAMCVAGSAIGGYVSSKVLGHTNTPCLWVMVVGKSSANKSNPIKSIMRPILEIDAQLDKKNKSDLKAWRELDKKAKNGTSAPKPKKLQAYSGKTTGAARCQFLYQNERGGVMYRDELNGFLKDFNGYGGTSEAEDMLTIFNGDTIKIDRKGEDEIMLIKSPFMPILGGIQPRVLREDLDKTYLNNGLLARFAVVFCRSEKIDVGFSIDASQENAWNDIVMKLRDFGNTKRVFNATKEATEYYHAEAINLFKNGSSEDKDRDESYNEYKDTAYSKVLYSVARLALIAHVVKIVENNTQYPYPDIDVDTMKWAFSCAPYLCQTQMQVYDMVVGQQEKKPMSMGEIVKAVADLCKRRGVPFNQSEFARMIGAAQSNVNRALNSQK